MAKKKVNSVGEVVAYIPKPNTKIYVYIQKIPNKLTPIPYACKSNIERLKKLINESDGIYSK